MHKYAFSQKIEVMDIKSINLSLGLLLISSAAYADEGFEGRAEVNWRYGQERSILMSEFWVPFAQDENSVLYGDLRMMGDDQDNREGNFGLGYRQITQIGGVDGVAGAHAWMDRRISARGSVFHQATFGTEWKGERFDILANGYLPLTDAKSYEVTPVNPQAPSFSGTSILVDANGSVIEEAQKGFDIEFGWEMGRDIAAVAEHTDSLRLYGGGYYFKGENTQDIKGVRARLAADITSDIQIGARFQKDDVRGSQGFLEATLRFPFGQKKKYREQGLRARLDEAPERDIDIVTGSVVQEGGRVALVNSATGEAQKVIHVDNTSGGGGDGSVENPYNTLASAQAATAANSIVYVHYGDGTTTGQNAGITLDKRGVQLIGSGVDLVYSNGAITASSNASPSSGSVIAKATTAPVITNTAGSGVSILADDVVVRGITVDGATASGILVEAGGVASSVQNVKISDVTVRNNKHGIYIHGQNAGNVSALVQTSVATSNTQHGMVVYDDTSGTFSADLGGGSLNSIGKNTLSGNTLEDLAVDYDGGTLTAMNNWWGQASGADTDLPTTGIDPQIYYGAPINDGLMGHLTFDSEWTSNTIAYDRSGNDRDGTLAGGLSLTNQVDGQNRQALDFDGVNDRIDIGASTQYMVAANAPLTVYTVYNADTFSGSGQRLINFKGTTGSTLVVGTGFSGGVPSSLYFTPSVGTNLLDDLALSAGTFYDTAVVYNGTNMVGYNNGVADSFVRTMGLAEGSASTTVIGTSGTTSFNFDGKIDEMRIYGRALTAAEIAQLHRMSTDSVVNTSGFLTAAP